MSKVTDLQQAQRSIQDLDPMFVGVELYAAIQHALAIGAPVGDPPTIQERARAYADTAAGYAQASSDLSAVAANQLPNAWRGAVAETASQAVRAVADEAALTQQSLVQAGRLLAAWADELAWAQQTDANGRAKLTTAQNAVQQGGDDAVPQARQVALDGIATRLAAAQRAEETGTSTASRLRQLAAAARAEHAGQGSLDPLSAVVLADARNPGDGEDGDPILTDNQLDRAGRIYGVMNGADQAAFNALLAGAKSPQESAYLWKALAAGHSVADIQQFDAGIHPHGDDPVWLSAHLMPATGNTAAANESPGNTDLTYQGQDVFIDGFPVYSQGANNDCVAASTVIAQARLDPLTMYHLTTGGTPDQPGADSPQAFQQRLQQMYLGQYRQGQSADGRIDPKTGIGPTGETLLAEQDLGAATGADYQYVGLGSDGDRQAAVQRIESSVDQGLPVPIDVNRGSEGHQMMIIGRDGDMLEIYNPWGRTAWVSEDQFVHGQLGSLTDGDNLNNAYAVELPK
ncbi:hypothetical protein OG455_08435 [Kitasatospora sp. NBC_01287]|uniref:hypothetical protein n=1 Tax=Kitasatospora sp. NBC_01287 TaxID=2903573 RepID=UPI00225A8C38|nr:hypothetical protein [Kitasatospora sp. NBC_01287]MCX4745549.1 hypothetical protein [Kitasatospora sp. NBC_01287]